MNLLGQNTPFHVTRILRSPSGMFYIQRDESHWWAGTPGCSRTQQRSFSRLWRSYVTERKSLGTILFAANVFLKRVAVCECVSGGSFISSPVCAVSHSQHRRDPMSQLYMGDARQRDDLTEQARHCVSIYMSCSARYLHFITRGWVMASSHLAWLLCWLYNTEHIDY